MHWLGCKGLRPCQAKREEVQRVKSTAWSKKRKQIIWCYAEGLQANNRTQNMKRIREIPQNRCTYCGTNMNQKDVQPTGRDAADVAELIILSHWADIWAVREKHREVHSMCQDDEEIQVPNEDCDAVRSKGFNLNSMQLVILARLKTKLTKELNYANIR